MTRGSNVSRPPWRAIVRGANWCVILTSREADGAGNPIAVRYYGLGQEALADWARDAELMWNLAAPFRPGIWNYFGETFFLTAIPVICRFRACRWTWVLIGTIDSCRWG